MPNIRMRCETWLTVVFALGTWALTLSIHAQTPVPSTRQLTVDLADKYRPATHVASGSLYGLGEGPLPDPQLLLPTKPLMFTQTAPGGKKVLRGDAALVAPLARMAGAKIAIRMSDIYPDFPQKWLGWDDWNARIDTIVTSSLALGAESIYAFELWNEPNWTWDTATAGSFNAAWVKTFERVRSRTSTARLMGPSTDRWDPAYMRDFLTYAKAHNALPDVISWHEFGFPEGTFQDTPVTYHIKRHVAELRAIESSLGLQPRPICINEYSTMTEEGVPGSLVRYFAQFERSGVESANVAFWFQPSGHLGNIVTSKSEPTGGWWLFKWYGDMTGQMAMTIPAAEHELNLDGIASVDPDGSTARVLFGGSEGDNLIVVRGFSAPFQQTAHVRVQRTPWYGPETAVREPVTILEGNFTIQDDRITVPITAMDKASGYNMVLTPGGEGRTRFEAEDVAHSGRSPAATASNGAYLEAPKGGGPLAFEASVPEDGTYDLQIRYANDSDAAASQHLTVNGEQESTVTYPRTGGGMASEKTGLATTSVSLKKGKNRISLSLLSESIDLDYFQLVPSTPDRIRMEVEKGDLDTAMVEPSSFASGQYFVALADLPSGTVQLTPTVRNAGTYTMDVGYANPAKEAAELTLAINGKTVSPLTLPSTGGRFRSSKDPHRVKSVPVELVAGPNTIRFTYEGVGYSELDYIELRPEASPRK